MGNVRAFLLSTLLLHAFLAYCQSITVVTESFPPYSYTDERTGKQTGLGTDLVKALLAEVGMTAEIQELPWARSLKMAQESPNVLIYSMKRNATRESSFKWIGEIVLSKAYLVAMKGSLIAKSDKLDDFKDYRVGAVRDGANARQLAADGFKNIVLFSDRESCWKRMEVGHIDLWCTDILSAVFYARAQGNDPSTVIPLHSYEALSRDGLYVAFSLSTDDALLGRFRQGWKRLKDNGTYAKILSRYSGN